MAPGWAIRFVCGIGSKGSVMLAQKGRLASRAKMRDAGRDAKISRIKKRGEFHGVTLSERRSGQAGRMSCRASFTLPRIQGPNRASVKTKTCRAGDDRLRAC
jgi:hypothetical protein